MSRGARGRGNEGVLYRVGARRREHGQSMVEFALLLPLLLLLVLIAVDFGRVYLGWINLQNMARIGADFAANHAEKMAGNDTDTVAKYTNQIASDASASNCPLAPGQPAAPAFFDLDSNNHLDPGDRVSVTLVCRFHVITPLIAFIVGSDLNVTVTSVFPVKAAQVETSSGGGGGGGCLTPNAGINATPSTSGASPLPVTFRDASGGGSPTSWHWVFTVPAGATPIPDSNAQDPGQIIFTTPGTYTVTLQAGNACGSTTSPATTITVGPTNPPPTCVVPDFNGVKRNKAQAPWTAAGFSTTVQDAVGAPPGNGWTINNQDIVAQTSVPCSSTIRVNGA